MHRLLLMIVCLFVVLAVRSSVAYSDDDVNATRLRLSLECKKLFARFAEERYWTGSEKTLQSSLGRAWAQVMRVRFALARLQIWKEGSEASSPLAVSWADVKKALECLELLQGEDGVVLQAMISTVRLSEMSVNKTLAPPLKSELSEWLENIQRATSEAEAKQFVLDVCVAAVVADNPDFANLVLPEKGRPLNFMKLVEDRRASKEKLFPGGRIIDLTNARLADVLRKVDDQVSTRIREMMAYKDPKTPKRKPPTGRPGNVAGDDEKKKKPSSAYEEAEEFLRLVEKLLGRPLTDRESALVLELSANEGYTVAEVVARIREMDKILNTAKPGSK
jgi:hypothetical protein